MKATIQTKQTRRALTTLVLLTMVFSMGQGQGLLFESASGLLKSLIKSNAEQPSVILTDYPSTKNFKANAFTNLFDKNNSKEINVSVKEFTPTIVKSFTVHNVDIAVEEDLESEIWMTKSFSNEIETPTVVESWMTESISDNFEEHIETENWMTESFSNDLEATVIVEDWMNEPFLSSNNESELEVENWMTVPLYTSLEEEIAVEDWMLQLLN